MAEVLLLFLCDCSGMLMLGDCYSWLLCGRGNRQQTIKSINQDE